MVINSFQEKLVSLYGKQKGAETAQRLEHIVETFRAEHPELARQRGESLSEQDVVLITYGDSLQESDRPPLQALHDFLVRHLRGTLSTVHILPFFPYSSDDGFSIIDYMAVNPAFGDWNDIRRLGRDFKLMFDAVINHTSAQSDWFQAFLTGDPAYREFFITVDPSADLSDVVRPRSLPLLTPFETSRGTEYVWTTFSADQIDLNAANPELLLRLIEILLFYVSQGASLIRLDAIAYLWKIPGTRCIHLPQTHTVIQLFRAVLDYVAPHVLIISETNVPHAENVSYLRDDEAQMVYQFTLPPLMLHTFATGDATQLSEWALGIQPLSARATYFNFTASHDGIGVRPVEDILSHEQVDALIERTKAHGGRVSYKANPDGSLSPYELNINYFDALSDPAADEPLYLQVQRFIASQAIELAFVGVPGIYIHSLLGSRSWVEGIDQTGHFRSINREKLRVDEVEQALGTAGTLRQLVFDAYCRLIQNRTREKAFHPTAPQQVLNLHPAVFALLRLSHDGTEQITALHNVSNQRLMFDLDPLAIKPPFYDLVGDQQISTSQVTLEPYQVMWLKSSG